MLLVESSETAEYQFDALCAKVAKCQACERMCNSQRVLNRSAGSLKAYVMFIGEAPGRLGADGSGIPFHGDKAGHNFEDLLQFAGIERANIFVTNAVLCNPRNEDGNNSTPTTKEIENCASFLRSQIDLINPKIVVTLGSVALKAASLIEPHNLILKEHVRTAHSWNHRIIIPVYHPGQRAMLHRSFANQRSDYQFIADQLNRLSKPSRKIYGKTKADIVDQMLKLKPSISYFALHKLFYLIENQYYKQIGQRLTSAYFVRQKDGPYCTDLHPVKLKKILPDVESKTINGIITIYRKNQLTLFESIQNVASLSDEVISIINEVMTKYDSYTNSDLKRAVYLTAPMRYILKLEKHNLINLYNSPIDFYQ
jgi:uracil-DNA glycosylase family 4